MAIGFKLTALLIVLTNWLVCPTFGVSLLPNVTSDMLSKCYDADQFRTLCTENFRGVADGGRCFYFTPFDTAGSTDMWDNGWKQCSKYNSKLANLQTEGEFGKIADHAVSLFGVNIPPINIGLKDEYGAAQSGKCCVSLTTTNYWYQDQTTAYTQISPSATWLGKYHMCDDTATQAPLPRCWIIYRGAVVKRADKIGIGDYSCSNGGSSFAHMCEFTTTSQTYTQNDSCVAEPPIQTSNVTTPQDCAENCSQLNWCRGFNYVLDPSGGTANQCQLFTWSIDDKPLTKSDPLCVYYSYVP